MTEQADVNSTVEPSAPAATPPGAHLQPDPIDAILGDQVNVLSAPRRGAQDTFPDAVRQGLCSAPKHLDAKYLYDQEGARLFEQICALPEYYLTRTESGILSDHVDDIVHTFRGAQTLSELGAGSARKTQILIDRFVRANPGFTYNPIDISAEMIRLAADRLTAAHERLRILAMLCEYEVALKSLDRFVDSPKVIAFLGSSIGNMTRRRSVEFLKTLSGVMSRDDSLLIGIDMEKDAKALKAAYDDAQGVTARFNTNVLRRINRELDADIDVSAFRYEVDYNQRAGRIEAYQTSTCDQTVRINRLNMSVHFKKGERVHTESSHKYTRERFGALCAEAELSPVQHWSDPRDWYRVVHVVPAA